MGLLDLFRPKWKHSDPDVRGLAARARIRDPHALGEVARGAKDATIRREALAALVKSGAPEQLKELALLDVTREMGLAALEHIEDLAALDEIARSARNKAVRKAA